MNQPYRQLNIVRDFESKAKAIEQETYEHLSAHVNWETYAGDDSEVCERAFDAGLSFYETMVSLYQATLNLFSAGLFHLIEQQLANVSHDGAIECELFFISRNPIISWQEGSHRSIGPA